eukprot:TRINITY_DN2033_c0_g1_i5.p1 TRINITY_DN2033_c0_g1~~TRINITY_DN2033_c0_g1_i5.p1  ORF type:complete len:242 (+),score=57.19 TRINITY_DN2033_c0_g1_i5:50-775(+)
MPSLVGSEMCIRDSFYVPLLAYGLRTWKSIIQLPVKFSMYKIMKAIVALLAIASIALANTAYPQYSLHDPRWANEVAYEGNHCAKGVCNSVRITFNAENETPGSILVSIASLLAYNGAQCGGVGVCTPKDLAGWVRANTAQDNADGNYFNFLKFKALGLKLYGQINRAVDIKKHFFNKEEVLVSAQNTQRFMLVIGSQWNGYIVLDPARKVDLIKFQDVGPSYVFIYTDKKQDSRLKDGKL